MFIINGQTTFNTESYLVMAKINRSFNLSLKLDPNYSLGFIFLAIAKELSMLIVTQLWQIETQFVIQV
jgi:hypothetical protein